MEPAVPVAAASRPPYRRDASTACAGRACLRLGLEGDRARRAVRRSSVREGHVGRDGEFTRERVLPGLVPERAVCRDAVGGLGAVRERLVVVAGALELASLDRDGCQAGEPEVDVRVVALRGPVDELPL